MMLQCNTSIRLKINQYIDIFTCVHITKWCFLWCFLNQNPVNKILVSKNYNDSVVIPESIWF